MAQNIIAALCALCVFHCAITNVTAENASYLQSMKNQIFDGILDGLSKTLMGKDLGVMPLDDANGRLSLHYVVGDKNGQFNVDHGTLRNLNLRRTKDVVIDADGLKFSVKLSMGIKKPEIHYDHFRAQSQYFRARMDDLTINIDFIKIDFVVDIDFNRMPGTVHIHDINVKIADPEISLRKNRSDTVLLKEHFLNSFRTEIKDILANQFRKAIKNLEKE
ncbi:hypothetical protein TKK_0018093 [Trichogramma kaykai]